MDTKNILSRRVDQLCELLSFDRERVLAWGFAQAVLAAVWALDGKTEDGQLFIECAQVLAEL